jgi:hypothetical protein
VDLDQGEISLRIGAYEPARVALSVIQRHLDVDATRYDMLIRNDVAVSGDKESRAYRYIGFRPLIRSNLDAELPEKPIQQRPLRDRARAWDIRRSLVRLHTNADDGRSHAFDDLGKSGGGADADRIDLDRKRLIHSARNKGCPAHRNEQGEDNDLASAGGRNDTGARVSEHQSRTPIT